jgi:hypothetical protein
VQINIPSKIWLAKISDLNLSIGLFVCLMVLNATFNNISAISWQ